MSPLDGSLSLDEERLLEEAAAAHVLADARAAFGAVPRSGTVLQAAPGDYFPRPHAYTSAPENGGGRENHFQGCQLLADGRHLAVSGGDPLSAMSHVFVVRMPEPGRAAEVVARIDVDATLWHAGGIDRCGHILAVPVECARRPGFFKRIANVFAGSPVKGCDRDRSQVVFYWMERPEAPVRMQTTVVREGKLATAVALARTRGRYLLVVLSARGLDFYFSRSAAFASGFDEPVTCPAPRGLPGAQSINLLNGANGELLLAAFDNTGLVNPPAPDSNAARLFAVKLPEGERSVAVEPVAAGGQFVCPEGLLNFDGGASFDARDGALTLHAVFHFRDARTGALQIARFGTG